MEYRELHLIQASEMVLTHQTTIVYNIYKKINNNKNLINAIEIKDSECEQCKDLPYCKGGCPMVAYSYFNDYKKCDITRKEIYKYIKRKRGNL